MPKSRGTPPAQGPAAVSKTRGILDALGCPRVHDGDDNGEDVYTISPSLLSHSEGFLIAPRVPVSGYTVTTPLPLRAGPPESS